MNRPVICEVCQRQVSTESTGGLCPSCLLASAMQPETCDSGYAATLGSDDGSSSDPKRARQQNTVGEASSNLESTPIGEFGDYELLAEIARGGMGVVYQAKHRTLNRVVALKMILAGQLASDSDIQRFQREAEAAASLDHSGIVPIYEIGEVNGQHFFSMKLIEGGSLAEHMAVLRNDIPSFVRMMEAIARAVHYAHQRGVLHRDLKPANILLDENGGPLITDLGLARQIESGSDITRTGAVVGTPAYMPPEQAAAEKEVTTAVDIYAMGAMLYEALTGIPPHVGESPVQTLMLVMNSEVTPPREVNKNADKLLERICLECLEKDPEARYASAAAFANDLSNWSAGKPISIKRPSLVSSLGEFVKGNLRSALGASFIGLAAGVLVAFCISRCNSKGFVHNNPPDSIYAALPGVIPWGESLIFLTQSKPTNQTRLSAALCWLATIVFVGGLVAVAARPRPGTEAVAFGLIAGLLMSISLFALYLSVGIIDQSHLPQMPTLTKLADAAVGPAEMQLQAKEELFASYPGLRDLPEDDRGRVLSYRVLYDAMFSVPIGLVWGMTMSLLLGLFPCFLGTNFAAKLIDNQTLGWLRMPAYLEFMGLVVVTVFLLFFGFMVPLAESRTVGSSQFAVIAVLGVYLAFLSLLTYRQSIRWYWRLCIVVATIATLATIS